jgi:uncharacterized protein YbjT (DUF2867 family)
MILVGGATGQLGSTIVRRLVGRAAGRDQGRDVRILVRPGSDFQPLVALGAQPVIGDLKDRASLTAVLRGIDVVLTTASAGSRGGDDTPETVDLVGNQNLIDAAKEAGVQQFIFISTLGASLESPMPLPRAKAQTENALGESGITYTILASWPLLDVWVPMVVGMPLSTGQPVTLVGEGRHRHSFVCYADVAAFATAAIGHPAALNQRIPVGGPEGVCWQDIVAAVSRALGRSIPVRTVAPGQMVPGLPDFVTGLMTFLETFDSVLDMTETARTFGVQQTTLEAFVHASVVREPASAG